MGRSQKGVGEFAPPRRGLLVGNYCHDVLIRDREVVAETLGGAASFISVVHASLSIQCEYVSKVGSDFAYFDSLDHKPIVSSSAPTTLFRAQFGRSSSDHDDENGRSDRILKRAHACESIRASDLPEDRFDFGLAVGVGGEILPETLQKMLDICAVVFADIQALIRSFDSCGTVSLTELKESGFYHLLPRLSFLKASTEEALKMDVDEVRRMCCVVVTNGKEGCTVYNKDLEMKIAPFLAVQVDPTGAGDSFLGGFAAGLVQGLSVPDAALLGNLFGSLAVQYVGLPDIDSSLVQRINNEVQRRKSECSFIHNVNESKFAKQPGHEQFHLSLCAALRHPDRSPPQLSNDLRSIPRDLKSQYQELEAPSLHTHHLINDAAIPAVKDHTTH
uniref:Carbohydrate kinase PfkB domain-containing protein n=1 Tax=Kalanchoe fedtschenkoi TaxID=63787 RepID=A0A7N0TG17_KALFE